MAGLLRQLLGTDRPMVPSRRLPTDGWCEAAGLGRMSLVWPWYQNPEPQQLVDDHGREISLQPSLEIRAPRSDGEVVLVVWSGAGGGIVVGPDWAKSMAKMYPGARIDLNAPFALDGAVGRVARFSDAATTTWRLLVPRESAGLHLEVSAPAQQADAYWAQIESMLATWGWDD